MTQRRSRKPPVPLDEAKLRELALAYVGRFSTTRAKLRTYLSRKIRERGWSGEQAADVAALAQSIAARGYIDDRGYALAKSQALTARGYGRQRVLQRLRAAGIEEDDFLAARQHAESQQVIAALRFAERRRIGPFAVEVMEPKEREKALGSMVRAGHPFALARAITNLAPGASFNRGELEERARNAV